MAGSSAPLAAEGASGSSATTNAGSGKSELYPSLRQLPRLAVPYADLYRRVKTQEAAFELLTQQYELARIEEARDVPAVSVIDAPGIPEKKAFPPRLMLACLLTFLSFAATATLILARDRWSQIDARDPRKLLVADVLPVMRNRIHSVFSRKGGAA
jgi:hypothetical protein